jgi:hypothetical protein
MNAIHVQMIDQQDLIKMFHYYKLQFNGYLYFKKHGSHINTFKKIKSMIHSKLFIFFFFFGIFLH